MARLNAKAKGPNAAFRYSWPDEPVQGAVGEPVVVFAASIKRLGAFQTGLARVEQRKALVITAQRPIAKLRKAAVFGYR